MLIKTKLRSRILKKNIVSELTRIEHTRVFFFDESRFGTHSKIGMAGLRLEKDQQLR